ncbi:MAG: DUF3810 domain-containing protein [Lachnospiraceae bacterium]|nr:DUF3810 domain-containing protein [Lachnospiraceae bacterium]
MKTGFLKIVRRNRITLVLLLLSGLLLFCARTVNGFAEWYATHIYTFLVNLCGGFFGFFPFSVSELLLYLLLLTAVVSLLCSLKKGPRALLHWLRHLMCAASVLLLLFVLNCGINYYRSSFSQKTGITAAAYSSQELEELCLWLTEEINARASQVSRDADDRMLLPSENAGQLAVEAMHRLGELYPDLQGYYPRPKPVLFSKILSLEGLTGIYSAFTIEANYNRDMTAYNIPFTMCHELSHLRGFMQEEEANFIAFLACENAAQTEFQYSGYLTAWIHATNALYRADRTAWQEVRALLCEEAQIDLNANNQYWAMHDGLISEVSDAVNDTYLKANGQSEGIKSYGRMVDLLLTYWMEKQQNGFLYEASVPSSP